MKNFIQRLLSKYTAKAETEMVKSEVVSGHFLLECWNQYADLPAVLVPYVDRIKTKEEWEALGFQLEPNRLGQVRKFKVAGRYFSFIKIVPSHAIEEEAVRTGKRLTQNPAHIRMLLAKGCQPEEFINRVAYLQTEVYLDPKKIVFGM